MDRRDTLRSMGFISAHALFPSILSGFVAGCAQKSTEGAISGYTPLFFSPEEFETLREVTDLILPATKTASASIVGTHAFLDEVFAKCMNADQQLLIKEGFSAFMKAFNGAGDKEAFLREVDAQAFQFTDEQAWFRTVKQYTLIGFFTSQEGVTKASNYVPAPGDYDGELPADKSTLNYGKTTLRYYL